MSSLMRTLGWIRSAPGKSVRVRPSDTFVTSYPRSGNTLARFWLGALISGRQPDFETVHDLVPDIYMTPRWSLAATLGPRYLKSHEPGDRRYRHVIYVVRDPRDVVISYFHYLHSRDQVEGPIGSFVADWLDGSVAATFGGWGRHVRSWLDNDCDSFLLVRYEDMVGRPETVVKEIADFVGAPSGRVDVALSAGNFTRMQRIYNKPHEFVRAGATGQWRTSLSDQAVDTIESAYGPVMAQLGYL